MNIQTTITFDKNWDDVRDALRRNPQTAITEFNTAIKKSVLKVQSEAMHRAPVNKQSGGGNLRQSIRSKVVRLVGEVVAYADYAVFVHEGTKAHIIRPVNKKVLANRRTGQFFGRLVHHPGTKPQPFLKQAVEAAKGNILQYFGEALERIAALR
jgi:HK97 gp10 family phage protein